MQTVESVPLKKLTCPVQVNYAGGGIRKTLNRVGKTIKYNKMVDIQLNFINNSNDRNNSQIVVFQKNQTSNYEEIAVAWKVIENCGQGWSHPFLYPMAMFISASDSWGNYSPLLPASNGQLFNVVENGSGDILQYSGQNAGSLNEIDVCNALNSGAMNANVYKDGRLLATKTGIAPQQKAVFEFKPTIWIGVTSQVTEGQLMNSAIISQINTEISLFGIRSADIIMSGGGPGPNSTAFTFTLQNVVYA